MPLKLPEQIREYFLVHQNAMFEAWESVENNTQQAKSGGGTAHLDDENWGILRRLYDGLPKDVKTLLLLAVIYHDIGKPIHGSGHAARGTRMLVALNEDEAILQSAVVREGGWDGNVFEPGKAFTFLTHLVEFHEVYGNYATGEQSLLGFEPILASIYKAKLDLNHFLDALLILGALDVAGTGKKGYLYNVKIQQYMRARKKASKAGKDLQGRREQLIALGSKEAELVPRVMALAYSYGSKTFYDNYEEVAMSVKNEFLTEVGSLCPPKTEKESFFDALSRIRKMAYALRHFGIITGVPQANPPIWPPQEGGSLKALIRLLWILAIPVRGKPDEVFEINFLPKPDEDAALTLRTQLESQGWRDNLQNCDAVNIANNLLSGTPWKPLDGLSIQHAGPCAGPSRHIGLAVTIGNTP
ncbi:MAG: hypothetical protein GX575_10925 [Candidatus Anammoximicrobium sp.]|nr:hypothetical protein [Candidatus Anammoximicrobium sp.]